MRSPHKDNENFCPSKAFRFGIVVLVQVVHLYVADG